VSRHAQIMSSEHKIIATVRLATEYPLCATLTSCHFPRCMNISAPRLDSSVLRTYFSCVDRCLLLPRGRSIGSYVSRKEREFNFPALFRNDSVFLTEVVWKNAYDSVRLEYWAGGVESRLEHGYVFLCCSVCLDGPTTVPPNI
jgi:hypothetical protein